MIIKVLLVAAFVLLGLFAARLGPSPRHLAVRRVSMALLVTSAVTAVLFPDLVTSVASLVGVGRGTDLVLYAFVVVSVLMWLTTYRRLAEMDARITQLVRAVSLSEARAQPPSGRNVGVDPSLDGREPLDGVRR